MNTMKTLVLTAESILKPSQSIAQHGKTPAWFKTLLPVDRESHGHLLGEKLLI